MFIDPSRSVYLILFVAAFIAAAVWKSRRTRGTLIAFAVTVLVLIGVTAADKLVESPREEAVRRVQALAVAINERNEGQFLAQLRDDFQAYGKSKATVKNAPFWQDLQQYGVRVAVWDFNRDDVEETDTQITIGFRTKGEISDGKFLEKHVKATFEKDAGGEWRLKTVKFFNFINVTTEEPIPGFP